MNKTLERIKREKVIAIVRGVALHNIIPTVQALVDGGISCVEVTFNQSDLESSKETLENIATIKNHFKDRVLLGAGTVMSQQNVEDAYKAGATYIISPNINYDVIAKTKELGLVSIPGAMTPTEAVNAYEAGADIIKLFPAGDLGVSYIKSICSPLNHIPFVAVGGINEKNIDSFLKAGVIGVGVGGNLVNRKYIEEGSFIEITKLAEKYNKLEEA